MSIRLMSKVWESEQLSGSLLLLLLALADHANDQGVCWPSVKTLAKKARLKERQTQYLLRELETGGYLRIEQRGAGRGHCTHYIVHVPKWLQQKVQSSAGIIQERVQSDAERVQSTAGKGAVLEHKSLITVMNHQKTTGIASQRRFSNIMAGAPPPGLR